MTNEEMQKWLEEAAWKDREDTLRRVHHQEMQDEYDNDQERLAASIELTKKIHELGLGVAIGSVVQPCDAWLCFHLYRDKYGLDPELYSMFRIENHDDCRWILQFTDDLMPYIRDRLYDETHYPIQILEAMSDRLKEVKEIIRQNPFSEELKPYCERGGFTPFTQKEISESKDHVCNLMDMFAWWIDRQIEQTSSEDMFVVFGP